LTHAMVHRIKFSSQLYFDHHAKFRCCLSYRVGTVEGPRTLGPGAPSLVTGSHRNTLLPTCHLAEFGRSRSNGSVMEIFRKHFCLRVPLFKVAKGHRKRHGSIG